VGYILLSFRETIIIMATNNGEPFRYRKEVYLNRRQTFRAFTLSLGFKRLSLYKEPNKPRLQMNKIIPETLTQLFCSLGMFTSL